MCTRHSPPTSDDADGPHGADDPTGAQRQPVVTPPALSDDLVARGFAARLAERGILFYRRRVSSLKPTSTCRYEPTCSAYGLEAVRRFGAVRGLWLATLRILRCAPWHPGGWDPVPSKFPGLGSWWRRMHR